MDIPFDAIERMPIDIAIAILTDERPNNTRRIPSKKSPDTSTETLSTTKIATKRRHSKPKA